MSLKKTILFDLNLVSGSSDLLRNAVSAYYENNGGIEFGSFETPTMIQMLALRNSDLVSVDKNSYLPVLTYPVRIAGSEGNITSDEEWRAYLIGGEFADKQYSGMYTTNVYGDHAINDYYLPYKPSEVQRNSEGLSPSIVLTTEYYQNYSRYQAYAGGLSSELMLPNYYNLDSSYFAVSSSDGNYPRHQYPYIKEYLNNTFVNEQVDAGMVSKNRNIFVMDKLSEIKPEKHYDIESDSAYRKTEDDLSKIYSLMPFANKLEIGAELTNFNSGDSFRTQIEDRQYEYKFLKLLKETFQNEISLAPTTINFGLSTGDYSVDYEAGTLTEVASSTNLPLKIVDAPTMLLYGFRNPTTETTDISALDSSSFEAQIQPFDDTSGAYRHIAADRSLDVLSSFKDIISTNFASTTINDINGFLSQAGSTKYHETVAFRIQKIGGTPTGDSRTENIIQNIWFYNRNEAIKYIDTQVKYGIEYTYKVFSYVLLQGYKHQTTGLVATRKIADDGSDAPYTQNCLEFYDPYTNQTSPQLAGEDSLRSLAEELSTYRELLSEYLRPLSALPLSYQRLVDSLSEEQTMELENREIFLTLGENARTLHQDFDSFIPSIDDFYDTVELKIDTISDVRERIDISISNLNKEMMQESLKIFSPTLDASAFGGGDSGLGIETIYFNPLTNRLATSPRTGGIAISNEEDESTTSFYKSLLLVKEYLENTQSILDLNLSNARIDEILYAVGSIEYLNNQLSNILASNAQINTQSRYLADFNITIEPSVKIVEIPLEEKTMRIVDHPPNDFNVSPHHLQDQSNRLAFYLKYDTFSIDTEEYPPTINPVDDRNEASYKEGKDFVPGSLTKEESVSPARFIEVYRTMEKPSSYRSFENNLRKTIDLKNEVGDIMSDHFFTERVRENTKYYYTFRAVNENGVAGQPSPIFESELINDGGYVYGLFNQLNEEELIEQPPIIPTLAIKNLFNVVPNIQHLQFDTSNVDFSDNSVDQIDALTLGTAEEFWNQKFKIRLTSKKTGRKVDLNLTFERKKK